MKLLEELDAKNPTYNARVKEATITENLLSNYPNCFVIFKAVAVFLTCAIVLPIHLFAMQSTGRDLTMQMLEAISGFGITAVLYMVFTTGLSVILVKKRDTLLFLIVYILHLVGIFVSINFTANFHFASKAVRYNQVYDYQAKMAKLLGLYAWSSGSIEPLELSFLIGIFWTILNIAFVSITFKRIIKKRTIVAIQTSA